MDKKDIITDRSLIVRELFYFFTVLAALSVIMEIIWPNIILAYFNLNYLLIVWLISGLALLFCKK